MKTFLTLIVLAVCTWCSPAFAEYCAINSENGETTCTFKTNYTAKDTRVAVTYTPQGWTLTVTVLLKEFAMIEGNSRVETKDGQQFDIEYVSTSRDMAPRQRKWKEMPVYLVSEELLRVLGSTKGKVRFWLTAEDPKELELKFSSGMFEDIDAFIAETKAVLGDQFKDE